MLVAAEAVVRSLAPYARKIESEADLRMLLGRDEGRLALNKSLVELKNQLLPSFPELAGAYTNLLGAAFDADILLQRLAGSPDSRIRLRLQAFRAAVEELEAGVDDLRAALFALAPGIAEPVARSARRRTGTPLAPPEHPAWF